MKSNFRLKLWQNIALVILAGVVPMVVITLGVITVSINKDIDFGRWETFGLAYQRPLEQILDALPQYREACRKSVGAGTSADSRAAVEERIDKAFAALAAAQDEVGERLQFTAEGLASRKRASAAPVALKSQWEKLKNMGVVPIAQGDAVTDLVANVRMAIAQAGDTSNLILDPDLDSYYLMDVTLCALPQTQDRLGAMIPQVRQWLDDGSTTAHAAQIAALAALLGEADIARIEGDVQTVINEDGNFYGTSESLQRNLPAATKAYSDASRALLAQLKALSSSGQAPSADAFDKTAWEAHAHAQAMWTSCADELDRLLRTRIQAYRTKRTVSLLLTGLALAFSGLVTWWFILRLQRDLRHISKGLEDNAWQLSQIVAQITTSSQKLSESATEQASSIEETSSSLEELSSMSQSNVDSASNVTGLVKGTRTAAENGEVEVRGLSTAMAELQTSSADIAKIVRTIDEIAFQTNILALNAAVEAARAGESGAGFAVVADEVRSLAQRSAHAAKETSSQIENAIAHAAKGAQISVQVGEVLKDIAERVRRIDESAKEVATASREQSEGISQINVAIGQMDSSTQANASSAEESASAATELSQQTEDLKKALSALVWLIEGRNASSELITRR
jgi:hypothetical protein